MGGGACLGQFLSEYSRNCCTTGMSVIVTQNGMSCTAAGMIPLPKGLLAKQVIGDACDQQVISDAGCFTHFEHRSKDWVK